MRKDLTYNRYEILRIFVEKKLIIYLMEENLPKFKIYSIEQ